ncbi:MAG: ABC transporter substrate-binding protein [Anaerolineaceae bacterium]|nr:ABC transporter substrate-binding protein [Anaerolineaceae bacterium]MCB9102020.1 ABC transporter substrate-binding protein [Anaerolineales bacterium]
MGKRLNINLGWLVVFIGLLPFLVQCASTGSGAVQTQAKAEPAADSPAAAVEEAGPPGVEPPPGYEGKTWADVIAEARGQTINWYMWGGQDNINNWINGFVADTLKAQYDITLNQVPLVDTVEAVNKVLGEVEAGVETDGAVDMIWINGENFHTLRQADLLYGPFAQFLPNSPNVNWDDPSVNTDLGLPVDFYESPWGKARMVIAYDSAKLPEPPTTIDGLIEWIKANPGKFTYPAPPDFTGTAFITHLCYHAAGDDPPFTVEFDKQVFDETFPACWDMLNDIEPYLWREGQTYPESHARQQDLFANGEVFFDMAFNPAEASSLVAAGRFPETTRTFVFDSGTVANTHYVAIPANAAHKAAAMVLANFLLSPDAQYSKADVANWGDFPAVEVARLSPDWQAKFSALPRGVATLSNDILDKNRLPELPATWRLPMEKGWEENVLKR